MLHAMMQGAILLIFIVYVDTDCMYQTIKLQYIDSNMKSSNYMKIGLKPLNYFELQQTLKYQFKLETLWIKPQLNLL